VTYNVSDLAVNDYYNVYNNSVLAYSLKTDSSGVLPSFTIYLGSEHEIKVKENQPIIIWENPTPSDGAIWNYNWVYLNATIIDDLNTSAFFDWNYSLRGYWSFDYYNSTGIFDNSTYNNFGTFQSGLNASNITTGKYGNALKFDGFNDYLDCSNDSEFGITTNLTIEAWINGTNKQNISQNIYVVAKPFSYGLRVYNDTGNPNVGMIIRNSSNSSWYGLDTGANVLDSNWHQLVGVYNGSAIKIYIDGVLNKTSSPIIDTIFVSTDILRIGSYTSNYGNFNGIIDEVRLYNRALSSEEINASYNNGLYRLKHNFTSLSDGNYSYAAWSIDQIGLMKNSTRNLILDTTFPIIVIQSPQNITYPNNTIWFNVSLNEPGSWCGYSLNGATNVTMSNDSATHFYKLNDTLSDGSYHVVFYCNDTAGNTNSTEQWFSIHIVEMDITKALIPNVLVVMENETVNVTTDVKINRTSIDVYQLNVTDEIPYDFINYSASQVKVYFINYSSSQTTEITGSVSVSIVIPGGTTNKYVSVNVTNSSVGGYIKENDTIRLNYLMNSSQMELDEIRTMWTNATAKDVSNNQKSVQENFSINAAATLLRGWKDFYFPDIGNTQLITFRIFIEARGGPIGEIYVSDYVPPGASPLSQDNITVTYVNTTKGSQSLTNGTDYLVKNFSINTLPDGSQVSVYLYNFTYNSTPKWDTYLYDKENITIEYNVTIIGGGQWTLPTIISGFDPTTGKEIKTEMYTHVYVPLFDITIKLLTERVKPGNLVRAVLNMLNVGGPKAKVDVALFYSIKDRENNVLVEASDTFAVNEGEERELSLPLPEDAESGIYNFEALAKYVGREAVSSKPFTVEKEESSVPYVWILVIVALLVTVILVAIWRTRR